MPQISLYIDEKTHNEIEARAKLSQVSISKFIATILKTHFAKDWPTGFPSTFGSIHDESFVRHDVQDWSLDAPRESL